MNVNVIPDPNVTTFQLCLTSEKEDTSFYAVSKVANRNVTDLFYRLFHLKDSTYSSCLLPNNSIVIEIFYNLVDPINVPHL